MSRLFSRVELIFITVIFFLLFDNWTFFRKVVDVYPLNAENFGFLISTACVLGGLMVVVFSLITNRYTLKPLLIILVVISAFTNYFMQTYNVVIDKTMIQNMLETNLDESRDLLTLKMAMYGFFLGVFPAWLIYKAPMRYGTFKQELLSTLKAVIGALVVMVVLLLSFSKFYTSFFRENKPLRFYTNPTFYLHSAGAYVYETLYKRDATIHSLGEDAISKKAEGEKRKLTIMVVGEAARANRFSLNGYERQTNPLLAKEAIINLSNVSSCGTSTAISVPCMFSHLERRNYSDKVAKQTENVIDIIKRSGASVLWRDNNSDSKGVAVRVPYEDYRTQANNTVCDEECRDEGMLVGLQEYINAQRGDILIVLHQMGNHGPAYYKRYPKAYERFSPVCQTNQVEQCTTEEIGNAYDNAIVYTDYFLSKTIAFLKANDEAFQTALVYMADHGESLGEKGLYLHGIPYFMAPSEQTHVGALMWFGEQSKQRIDVEKLRAKADENYSHDNLFYTLLGLMGVQTTLYDAKKDILNYR